MNDTPTTPRVNWPEKKDKYDIVQLYVDDTDPYLGIGRLGHGGAARDLLKKLEIDFDTKPPDNFHPNKTGERYRICGGGSAIIDPESQTVKVRKFSDSSRYRVGIDREHLRKIQELEPEWRFEFV